MNNVMEKKTITLKELKKRKMLLVLPILALPFLTMIFWSLGGGKLEAAAINKSEKGGFNIDLPNPNLKEDFELNKMSFYDQAAIDSIKLREEIRKDPNYSNGNFIEDSSAVWADSNVESQHLRKGKFTFNTDSFRGQNEQKVYQKLEALQKAIKEPADYSGGNQDMREFENYGTSEKESDNLKNLEQMMSVMNEPQDPDPELKQLGGMLENILDIQHPDRMQDKLKQASDSKKGNVYAVDRRIKGIEASSLQGNIQGNSIKNNSFYSLETNITADEKHNSIEAVIHENQTIVNGSTVKLRLCNDIIINGIEIPKNTFLFGIASLKGERLEIKISNIRYLYSIFPVELSVYDMDGINGIYIPGAISRDVAKTSADRSLQTLGLTGLDDSWGAQAAGMGIEAAKSFMSKKVKLIKVIVKAGYQILLYDEKQKNFK